MPMQSKPRKPCQIAECEDDVYRRDWCSKHYGRWKRHGDPTGGKYFHGTPEERFWVKVDAEGDCWEWTAFRDSDGYGMFSPTKSHSVRAHRFAWELLIGPIPDELTVDHRCRNRGCVNPVHLEIVPNVVNVARGYGAAAQNARRDRCIAGHPLSGRNLYIQPNGKRMCRECKLARKRELNAKLKAERHANGSIANADKTHCIRNHPLSGGNLRIETRTGRRTCKKCQADWARARYRRERSAVVA